MYYYNNELPPQQGWVCPKCGRVNAPWLPICGCVNSKTRATFDTTSLRAEPSYHNFGSLTAKCINCANTGSYKCLKCDGEMYYKQTEPSRTYYAEGSGMIDSSGNTDCPWK